MPELVTIPCLADNFAYLLHGGGETVLIDAPEAAPILRALSERGWQLGRILLTHHHDDHIQAVPELVAATGAKVGGNRLDARRLPPLDAPFAPGDRLTVAGTGAEVLDAPGHTIGHIALHLPPARMVFTADSLMAMGCGRLFEGSPAQMWDTLSRLAMLPDDTLVCSGHDYLRGNGAFALSVEPGNDAVRRRMAHGPATPAPLSLERETNPFLRVAQLRAALEMQGESDLAVFTRLRAMKDAF